MRCWYDVVQKNGSTGSEVPIGQAFVHLRVLKDGFHLMDMIKLNKSHGMHKDFMRRFRDIIYVCDQDKALVDSYLLSIRIDWNRLEHAYQNSKDI